ncbi:MAG: hypothetical protein J6Y02_12900 [Pseudobutyrivibrio sp.]|nr:hypothetical protein [Pseudobutyrivibrio sp.]
MPDAETNALRRAKTLREEINTRTGVADTTVTEGVKRLLRSSGNEVAIQHEAAMHLDIYPDPIIAREEFSRMMDYGNNITIGHYNVTEATVWKRLEYLENTDRAWINTNYFPNVVTDDGYAEFEIVDTRTAEMWPGIATVQTRSNGSDAQFGLWYYTRGQGIGHGDNQQTYVGKHYKLNFARKTSSNASSFVFDGDDVTGDCFMTTTETPFSKPLALFMRYNDSDGTSNANSFGRIRLFEVIINRNGVLFHHYIPKEKRLVRYVENLDTGHVDEYILSTEIGYHDEVDDILYKNVGSGSFVLGPYIN